MHLIRQRLHAVIGQRNFLCIEGVGFNDIGAGSQVFFVNGPDDLRLRQAKKVVVALQVAPIVTEALAAEGALVQLVLLDHGAHRTIEYHDPLFEEVLQTLDALTARGHTLKVLGPYGMSTGVVAVGVEPRSGTMRGGADVRRERYIFGW